MTHDNEHRSIPTPISPADRERAIDASLCRADPSVEVLAQAAKDKLLRDLAEEFYRTPNGKKMGGLESCYHAIKFCDEKNLNPITAFSKMRIERGGLVLNEDLSLAIALASGVIEDREEFFLVHRDGKLERRSLENENYHMPVFAFVCRIKRRGINTWHESSYSMHDAERAGLISFALDEKGQKTRRIDPRKTKANWLAHTNRMLTHRARGTALRDTMSDLLQGLQTEEFDYEGGND